MAPVTIEDLNTLLEYSNFPCVSLHLSTDEIGLEATKREAMLQNHEKEVMARLDELGVSTQVKADIAGSLATLKADESFWEVGPKGLAIFIAPGFLQYFSLPIEIHSSTVIGHRFHLKSLIKLLTESTDFYLLSLAKSSVQLYKGDRYQLVKVELPDLPTSVEEVTGVEMNERNLQFHTGTTAPNGGSRPAIFHGSSSWKDDKHRYLERFIQRVRGVVEEQLKDQQVPLLLSGVERMVTTYREVSTYPHLIVDVALKGNDDHQSLSTLHTEAVQLLEPLWSQQQKARVEAVLDRGSADRFSHDLNEILYEATMGRVDTLLVAQGVREWGLFVPDALRVKYLSDEAPEAQDLLDVACAVTLEKGGQAHVLPLEEMPGQERVAALFRY